MLCIMLALNALLGSTSEVLAPESIKALKAREMPTAETDLPLAIDRAFEASDSDLFLALAKSLKSGYHADHCADQVLRLFAARPSDSFKKVISFSVAYTMSGVDRVVRSCWSCEFYNIVMPVLRDPSPRARQRFEAYMTLVNISGYTELSLAPYLVRVLLTMPKDEEEYGFVYLDDLQPRSSTVSPLFAYLIYKKYDGTAGLDKYKQAYADKAKVFLSGQEKLPSSSLSDLVAELDITIDGIGKKLCAKYDKVEPELGRVPFKPGDMSLP